MRILSITSTYPRFVGDGAGSFIHSISERLSDHGYKLFVIAPDNHKAQDHWQDKVFVERIKYIWPIKFAKLGHGESLRSDIQLKWYSYPLVSLFTFRAILRIFLSPTYRNVDVVYAHWLLPGGLIGAIISQFLKIPLVIHLHGSDVFIAERYYIFRPLVKYIIQNASKIIACSNDLATRVRKMGAKNVEVIPYGVDTRVFFPRKEQDESEFAFVSPKRITAIGRLVFKKGFEYLIMASEKVVKVYPKCEIQIAGDGDRRDDLIRLCNSLKLNENIFFLGNVPWNKIPEILRKTDIFVLPSIVDDQGNVDGLPNVLLEAMASGCAIIASKIGGVPDLIKDGVNGLLVEPRNCDHLSQAIISLLSDDRMRRNMGKCARETVEKDFAWDIIVGHIERVLKEASSKSNN